MISWNAIKQFPKLAIAFGVFLISTLLFAWWWNFNTPKVREIAQAREEEKKEVIAKKAELVGERIDRVFLADEDLYDAETGELIFTNWLPEIPSKLFYHEKQNKLLAMFPRGIIRYNLDGSEDARLILPHTVGFTKDYKSALYAREKNIWTADVNIEEMKLENEKQMTTASIFDERYFMENLVMVTEKVLVVQQFNKLLRIDRATGNFKQAQIPLNNIIKRRSPNGKYLVGEISRTFYFYDVDTEQLKKHPIGIGSITDYQWLDDDRCAFILMGKEVVIYDRTKDKLEKVAELPIQCHAIGSPSPDGKFVLCGNNQQAVLLNVESKQTGFLPPGSKGFAWFYSEALIFANHADDSAVRGTWLGHLSAQARLLSKHPFLDSAKGISSPLYIESIDRLIFVSAAGLIRSSLRSASDLPAIDRSIRSLAVVRRYLDH